MEFVWELNSRCSFLFVYALHCAKSTIHQVTTILATSKNVLIPGHNHLLTTGADDLTLWLSPDHQQVKGHQYQWLAGGYWPGNRTFLDVTSMVVTWWIVPFLCSVAPQDSTVGHALHTQVFMSNILEVADGCCLKFLSGMRCSVMIQRSWVWTPVVSLWMGCSTLNLFVYLLTLTKSIIYTTLQEV